MTFTSQFEKQLLEAHPQASSMLIDKLCSWLKGSTGKEHRLDFDQAERLYVLMDQCDALVWSIETRLINNWIYNGLRIEDAKLTEVLGALSGLYKSILGCDVETAR